MVIEKHHRISLLCSPNSPQITHLYKTNWEKTKNEDIPLLQLAGRLSAGRAWTTECCWEIYVHTCHAPWWHGYRFVIRTYWIALIRVCRRKQRKSKSEEKQNWESHCWLSLASRKEKLKRMELPMGNDFIVLDTIDTTLRRNEQVEITCR